MEKLCFSTFAKRLQKTLAHNGNEEVVILLIDLITDNVDIINRNGDPYVVTSKIASALLSQKTDVPKKIRDVSGTQRVVDSAVCYFEDVVIPDILPDLVEDLLVDMRQLIQSDGGIPQRTRSNFLALCDETTLAEFLSGVFLYAIKQKNKIDISKGDTVFEEELKPVLPKRSDYIPESDLYLLLEADSVCPNCGKTLVNIKSGYSLSGYTITEIIPTNPTRSARETLGDLINGSAVHSMSDNLIALCLDCSNRYSSHTTRDECLKLIQIKEKLRRNYDAAVMLDKMYLEEQIENVLRKIPLGSIDDITETLEYTALRVRNKITSNVPLIIKTEGFVVQYYQFIKSIFAQMEREGTIDFDGVAGDVKRSYRKLAVGGYSQEEIFSHLVGWFMKKTNTRNPLPCEIIVAFFVQNCEVFHALSK